MAPNGRTSKGPAANMNDSVPNEVLTGPDEMQAVAAEAAPTMTAPLESQQPTVAEYEPMAVGPFEANESTDITADAAPVADIRWGAPETGVESVAAFEAPAVVPTADASPEQAIVPAETGTIRRNLLELFKAGWSKGLANALQSIEDKTFAQFVWQIPGSGAGGIELQLKGFRPKPASLELEIVVQRLPARKESTQFTVRADLQNTGTGIVGGFWFELGSNKSKDRGKINVKWLDLPQEEMQATDDGFELKEDYLVLTRRARLNLDWLGTVWFMSPETRKAYGKSAAVRPPISASETPWTKVTEAHRVEYDPNRNVAWIVRLPKKVIASGNEIPWGEWARTLLSALAWGYLSMQFANSDAAGEIFVDRASRTWLPPRTAYQPRRAVDLLPSEVKRLLSGEPYNLSIEWHVVDAACAALNAGKHVIFTGPPGGGKSKLALALARIATSQDPVLGTASPAWNSGDLIGRYLPSKDGTLAFTPGLFLRALERKRWLLVDEFNRADIDACFGELFSVLAGDLAELPFEEVDTTREDNTPRPVRIVPQKRVNESESNDFVDYVVDESFRMLGTMNDADRSQLHQLSFALQRRIAIIRVDPPGVMAIKRILEAHLEQVVSSLLLTKNTWNVVPTSADDKNARATTLEMAKAELIALFCERDEGNSKSPGLVPRGIVGIATVKDTVEFVGEAIRTRKMQDVEATLEKSETANSVAEELVLSYLAIALTLLVFPQLEAPMKDETLQEVIVHIISAMKTDIKGPRAPYMRAIDEVSNKFVLRRNEPIEDFLRQALRKRLPHAGEWLDGKQ